MMFKETLSRRFMRVFALLAVGCIVFILMGFEVLNEWIEVDDGHERVEEAEERISTFLTKTPEGSILFEEYIEATEQMDGREDTRFSIVLYGLGGIALILSLAYGVYNARVLSDPIEDLSKATQKIASGNVKNLLPVNKSAPVELQHLAQDINLLALSLAQKEDQLRFTSAAVAHEIRTPLTVLRGQLHAMQDGLMDIQPSQITSLLKRLDALERLVSDIEDLSFIEGGELTINPTQTDITLLLSNFYQSITSSFPDMNFSFNNASHPIWLRIDAERIGQVFSNLIANTGKYAGESANVCVSVVEQDNELSIELTDDGPGFSRQGLTSATDAFWRGDPSRSRKTGGSGLGLSISLAIIERHEGTLKIENGYPKGAKVTITLPKLQHTT